MANTAPITIEQLFRFFRNLPHQAAAIQQLEQDLALNGYAAAMRRDRAWFQTWSQDGKQVDLAAALQIVKKYEGVRLSAYPDPGTGGDPWTIGWGNTRYPDGRPVQRGDKINMVEADMMLRREIDHIAASLGKQVPYWAEMSDGQKCALISFAYNCGTAFYGSSGFNTISRALKEKRWDDVPRAMMLYVNPGTSVEVGLRRRRTEEGTLWAS
ncbi:hypothetical protein EBT31_23485 [bacterium]|nr:hypothetical protein [bacterium]